MAIHHGRLPSPFLRELEVMLSEGVLNAYAANLIASRGYDGLRSEECPIYGSYWFF